MLRAFLFLPDQSQPDTAAIAKKKSILRILTTMVFETNGALLLAGHAVFIRHKDGHFRFSAAF
jgi:hypothetical protein